MSAHDRPFGVEIEFGMTGDYDDAIAWNIELLYDSGEFDGWEWDEDGTEFEFRSPILSGLDGFKEVARMMDAIRGEGGYVTQADGLHVHHDAPEFVNNPNLCVELVESWMNNIRSIHEMVAPRRRQNGMCPEWTYEEIERLANWASGVERDEQEWYDPTDPDYYWEVSRNDLNLASLSKHGSIEIRLHEGTLDSDVAAAWIKFGQRFLDRVVSQSRAIPDVGSDSALMSRIRLSPAAQRVIEAKKAARFNTSTTRYRNYY
jgi:hypothetical protein